MRLNFSLSISCGLCASPGLLELTCERDAAGATVAWFYLGQPQAAFMLSYPGTVADAVSLGPEGTGEFSQASTVTIHRAGEPTWIMDIHQYPMTFLVRQVLRH